ncbi:MAG: hypothetical protein IT428_24525 [Planctomycetaceae bacterium]|nr:hypothetical protein [Planctomycetaceae bacterium]
MPLPRLSSVISHPRLWVSVLIGLGIVLGIAGERVRWFGLFDRRLRADDCTSVTLFAPYSAWCLQVRPNGSAVLSPGAHFTTEKVGFGDWGTLEGLGEYSTPKCPFPAGSFDFPTLCRDLLRRRSIELMETVPRDYPDMPSTVIFGITNEFRQMMLDQARQGAPFDVGVGTLSAGEGQRLIESARTKAIEGRFWPQDWDDIWPYPAIPWGFARGATPSVPSGLNVTWPLKLQRSWTGVVSDLKLRDVAPHDLGIINEIGMVTDLDTWKQIWEAWRGDQQVPRIDFSNELILVLTSVEDSQLTLPPIQLGQNGNLVVNSPPLNSTNVESGFGYLMGTIPRAGIKRVNGRVLPEPIIGR